MNGLTRTKLLWIAAAVAGFAIGAGACAGDGEETDERGDRMITSSALVNGFPELHAFMGDYLEIDRLDPDSLVACDANYHTGDDPADGSPSVETPACMDGECDFVDWNNLCTTDLANHQLVDDTKSDSTAFPRSNHCYGPGSVLAKMDLTYIMAANNDRYAYFGVQRRNNNGDAAYYWLLTRAAPVLDAEDPDCHRAERGLWYDVQGGEDAADVMLIGHFHPSGTCELRVFYATRDAYVDAVDAVNYESDLWEEELDPDTLTAVNATMTATGACGAGGVDAQALVEPGVVEPEIFAEAAVPLSVLTGGNVCGASFYGSVITRPSASGGTSPDMKDIAGPVYLDFGSVEATAEVTARCDKAVDYTVTSITSVGGSPIDPEDPSVTCDWTFTNGATELTVLDDCVGTYDFAPGDPTGTWTAAVSVSVAVGGATCGMDVDAGSALVYEPVGASATATAECDATFDYSGSGSGGSGSYTYGWTFTGPGTATPSSSSTAAGTVGVAPAAPGNVYTAELTVTDNRADLPGACTDTASDTANPLAGITVSLDLTSGGQTCPDFTGDSLTWAANVGGGNPGYTYDWTVDSCDGFASCTIDPADSDFCPSGSLQLFVDDTAAAGLPACDGETSEEETWSKVTTTTASDN